MWQNRCAWRTRLAKRKKAVEYDESTIQTLDALEHIRLRTGMYIGRVGDGTHPADGVYVMLKEVIDNAVDEFIMGHGKRVDITREGDTVTVRDYPAVDCQEIRVLHSGWIDAVTAK